MKKAILGLQEANTANTGEGANETTAAAFETAKSNLVSAALSCDASKLADDEAAEEAKS